MGWGGEAQPKLELTYNEKEAAGSQEWRASQAYKDAIKLFAGRCSSHSWQASPFPPIPSPPNLQSLVGYSQVFQGLQAGERLLGHRLDLVSKQSPAVAKQPASQISSRQGRRRDGRQGGGEGEKERQEGGRKDPD